MIDELNLKKSSVQFYWKTQDPRMVKILTMMEQVEPWVVDEVESVARELVNFGKKMSTAKSSHLSKCSDDITFVMTYVFSGKALRLLNWLDENYPGLSFYYVMEARQKDDWEAGRLLLDRLKTIKTLSLLGTVFAPTRTRLISGLLEEDED